MNTANDQVGQDLAYVRQAVERREDCHRMPLSIAALWAGYTLIGFTGLDFQPAWAGPFLLLAAPVAYLLSRRLAAHAMWSLGESDADSARRHSLHWGSMLVAVAALTAIVISRGLHGSLLGQMILVVVALGYLLAAVHFSIRLFAWMGIAMMIGSVVLTYIDRWGWTVLGILLAAGFLATSLTARRQDA